MDTNTANTTDAEYSSKSHPAFEGNPLIEALPAALQLEEIGRRTRYLPTITEEDRLAPDYLRMALVEDINFAYLASPQLVRLYYDVYAKLMQGYRFRNPLKAETQRFMYALSANTRTVPRWNQTTANVSLFIGPSGFGKTTTIENLCALFPSVIQHSAYRDAPLSLMQPVILRVDCPSSGDKCELMSAIWSAFDTALGTCRSDVATYQPPILFQRIAVGAAKGADRQRPIGTAAGPRTPLRAKRHAPRTALALVRPVCGERCIGVWVYVLARGSSNSRTSLLRAPS